MFRADLGDVPDYLDWEAVKKLVKVLEVFYFMTLRISSSQYVTTTLLFTEIFELHCMLNQWVESIDSSVVLMGTFMKQKFDKY